MTATARKLATPTGSPTPRVAPPTPARSRVAEFVETAVELGIDLMPWQQTVARYLEAQAPDDNHLYREIAIVVARQNGKTEILVPLIVRRLLDGRRIMHTAQDRDLPREVFYRVAEIMWGQHPDLFPLRNDRPTKPRYANGQEEIRLSNGGIYSIVAPTRGGARGPTRDLVIIDELREMDTWDFIAAAKPTTKVAPDPQTVYLSNAGDSHSVVLNALRKRAGEDPNLAYLEWSAAPDRASDDIVGWAESNPAMGNERGEMGLVIDTLREDHLTATLEGTLGIFEVENLCRWVPSVRERLVDDFSWVRCQRDALERIVAPSLAVSMDPHGKRASVALAWQQQDGTIAMRLLYNVTGNPIDTDLLGTDIRDTAAKHKVKRVGFDPLTDAELVKYVKKPKPEPVSGQKFSNASAQFVNIVAADKLRWTDADAVSDDLTWTSRKPDAETGSYQAVRAQDDRPITASLAAIRAVWLASGPKPATPKVL